MIGALVNLIFYVLVAGLLVMLLFYVLDHIPVPDPMNRIIKLVVVVLVCLALILLLAQVLGINNAGLPQLDMK